MTQDPDSTPAEAIGELVDELVRAGASLSQIVAHMSRCAAAAPSGAEPAADVLRRLLCGVLEEALAGHSVTELLDAAGVVGCATDAIDRNVVLVDAGPPPPTQRRRSRGRGAGRRPR
ncbi:MAG TPA: hypothetical protein VK501_10995 [Baekduia sp.]|uniref:hypothetical protein n=1 Tax=Baekduia sp. TaxID=2600305 RepID=UPI002BB2CB95|nr:hypothetical protein [Baekduia sp.]HMJ34433.1 hypothetical protein [Baekduia sp.]